MPARFPSSGVWLKGSADSKFSSEVVPTSFGLFRCLWLAGHAAPSIGPSGNRSRAQGSASAVGTFSIWSQEGSLSSPWLAFPCSVGSGVFKSSAIPDGLVLAAAAGYVGTCSHTSEHCAFPVLRFVGLLERVGFFALILQCNQLASQT